MKRILCLVLIIITLTGCQNAESGFVYDEGGYVNHKTGMEIIIPEGYIPVEEKTGTALDTKDLFVDILYFSDACFIIKPEIEDMSYCSYIISLEKNVSNKEDAYHRLTKAKTELEESLINDNCYDVVVDSETIEFSGEKLMCAKAEYKKEEKQHYALLYITNTDVGYCYIFTNGKTLEEAQMLMGAIKIKGKNNG